MPKKDATINIGLNIPISIPTNEEMDMIMPTMETYLRHMTTSGYMTTEEAVAYIKFATHLAGFTSFSMDTFLSLYRSAKQKVE